MLSLTTSPVRSRRASRRPRVGYAIWFPLAVYAIARLVDVIFVLTAARHQVPLTAGASGLSGYKIWESSQASPSYGTVASNWDGQWYLSIADRGYPTTIPRDPAGQVLQNQWGFYPAFPFLVGAIMRVSGLDFMLVAPVLAGMLGAGAVTVMFRLINQTSGRFAASATVLLTCTYMAAPAMQIAYTESLALLLVCTALLLLRNRRYGWLVPILVTLALTRAVALAFVPVLIVHGISRYRRRFVEPFPVSDRWRVVGLASLGVAATGLWPAIAAVTTGDVSAYTQTMSSWGATDKLRILTQFPAHAWTKGGPVGLAVLFGIIALAAWLVLRGGARAWGPELQAWAGFYPLYLLLATAPGSSTIRHLFLAFPLLWPFPQATTSPSTRRTRVATIALLATCGLIMQWVWISQFLVVSRLPVRPPFP